MSKTGVISPVPERCGNPSQGYRSGILAYFYVLLEAVDNNLNNFEELKLLSYTRSTICMESGMENCV